MNECNVIRDLLPLWVEELVSEDSVEFITRHAENCPNCREAMERCREELPVVEVPQPDKKSLKSLRWGMIWMVLKGILIFMAGLGVFMGVVYFWAWEAGHLPIQKAFHSSDPKYEVYTVDWDTAGFFETGEGSIVNIQCGSSSWSTLLPWDDLDVIWAPNGADAFLTIETVEGKQEYRILEMSFTRDEASRKSMGSRQIIPMHFEPDLKSLLTEKCRAYSEFPTGWEEITFTFTQWEDDSETVIFHYATDTGESGFLSYHFPSEAITKIYQ